MGPSSPYSRPRVEASRTHVPALPIEGLAAICADAVGAILPGEAEMDEQVASWVAGALVHESYLAEHPELRLTPTLLVALESLGGSVASLLLVDEYLTRFPDATEGELSLLLNQQGTKAIEALASDLSISHRVLLGRGESDVAARSGHNQRIASTTVRRVLGAVALCGRVDRARDMLRRLPLDAPISRDAKTALQQAGGKPPLYECVWERGPDNAREFRWRVTANGRSAEGEGRSRRAAQRAAAEALLAQHPDLDCRPFGAEAREFRYARPADLPARHLDIVGFLVKRLGLPPDAAPKVSQALIHRSWSAENSLGRQVRHLGPLAHIGATALPAVFWRDVVSMLAADLNLRPRRSTIDLLDVRNLVNLAESLDIADGFVFGRGQSRSGATASIVADAAQALVGAVVVARGVEAWIYDSPAPIRTWVADQAAALVRGARGGDPKTLVQELGVAIGLDLEYTVQRRGPDHAAAFQARLSIRSASGSATIVGREDSPARAAEQAAARALLTVSRAVNRAPTNATEHIRRHPLVKAIGPIVLNSAALSATTASSSTWLRLGLMGTDALVRGSSDEFRRWNEFAEEIVGHPILTEGHERLFTTLAATGAATSGTRFAHALRRVADEVQALDVGDVDRIRSKALFGDIVDLAATARLAARSRVRSNIADVLQEWATARGIEVVGAETLQGGWLRSREGALPALLDELHLARGASEWSWRVEWTANVLLITVSGDDVQSAIPRRRQSSVLFHHLELLLAITLTSGDGIVTVACPAGDVRRVDLAVRSYGEGLLSTIPEPDVMARRLHDLKNQLVAAEVLASQPAATRTDRLSLALRISQHLDSATDLLAELRQLAQAAERLHLESVDLDALLREYAAEKVRTVPPGVRFVPPRSSPTEFVVVTARDALLALIENLVKNAVEAMGDGGSLTVDWLGDDVTGMAILEISDTGPGLPEDVLASVRAGSLVRTTKPRGSGLGLWSAFQLAARLGATLSVRTGGQGTTWTLEVPSLRLSGPTSIVPIDDVAFAD